MEKVKLLVCDLWIELYFSALENDIPNCVGEEILSQKQKKYIRDKIFELLTSNSKIDSLPYKSGKAFHIAWRNCTISYQDVANRLNEQLKEEGEGIKKSLTENDIKGYIFYIKGIITKRVREASKDLNWGQKLRRIK
jgi:predicted house-cleaning noncanonical NTP pyrophosphatase (MazG superfamily)